MLSAIAGNLSHNGRSSALTCYACASTQGTQWCRRRQDDSEADHKADGMPSHILPTPVSVSSTLIEELRRNAEWPGGYFL